MAISNKDLNDKLESLEALICRQFTATRRQIADEIGNAICHAVTEGESISLRKMARRSPAITQYICLKQDIASFRSDMEKRLASIDDSAVNDRIRTAADNVAGCWNKATTYIQTKQLFTETHPDGPAALPLPWDKEIKDALANYWRVCESEDTKSAKEAADAELLAEAS